MIHEKMAVVYMFLGRMSQAFPYPFAQMPVVPTNYVPPPPSSYQAPQAWSYATPSSTNDINEEAHDKQDELQEIQEVQETEVENATLSVIPDVIPITAAGDVQAETLAISTVEPNIRQLNPLAKDFVPRHAPVPVQEEYTEAATLPTPVTSPSDIQERQETAEDTVVEETFNWTATREDNMSGWEIPNESSGGWEIPNESNDGWGDTKANSGWEANEPECAWKMEPTVGGWDAGPDENAFQTPPKGGWELPPSKEEPGPSKKKEKKANGKKAKEEASDKASSGKDKESSKKSSQKTQKKPVQNHPDPKPSSQSSKSAFSVVESKTKNKVVIVNQQTTTTDVEIETYTFPLQQGSIIPSAAKQAEILQAHAALATRKTPSSAGPKMMQSPKVVDPEMEWVNGGTSPSHLRPDPSREFSQRSASSSTTSWVPSNRWPKPDKRGS
jgi:hypothetical protein